MQCSYKMTENGLSREATEGKSPDGKIAAGGEKKRKGNGSCLCSLLAKFRRVAPQGRPMMLYSQSKRLASEQNDFTIIILCDEALLHVLPTCSSFCMLVSVRPM